MSDEEIELLKKALTMSDVVVLYSHDKEDWQKVTSIGPYRHQLEQHDEPGPVAWLQGKNGFVALWNVSLSLDDFIVARLMHAGFGDD